MARRSSSAPASRGEHPAERPRKDVESPRGPNKLPLVGEHGPGEQRPVRPC